MKRIFAFMGICLIVIALHSCKQEKAKYEYFQNQSRDTHLIGVWKSLNVAGQTLVIGKDYPSASMGYYFTRENFIYRMIMKGNNSKPYRCYIIRYAIKGDTLSLSALAYMNNYRKLPSGNEKEGLVLAYKYIREER